MHPQAKANRSGQALGGDTNWSDRFVMTHSNIPASSQSESTVSLSIPYM